MTALDESDLAQLQNWTESFLLSENGYCSDRAVRQSLLSSDGRDGYHSLLQTIFGWCAKKGGDVSSDASRLLGTISNN
jgi:hypothetical protein